MTDLDGVMDEDRWGKMLSALRYVSPKDWGYVVPFVEDVLSEKIEAERARADRLAAALREAPSAECEAWRACTNRLHQRCAFKQKAADALADSPKEENDVRS